MHPEHIRVGDGYDRRRGLECERLDEHDDIWSSREELCTLARVRIDPVWSTLSTSIRRETRLRRALESHVESLAGLLFARGSPMPDSRTGRHVGHPLAALIVTAPQTALTGCTKSMPAPQR